MADRTYPRHRWEFEECLFDAAVVIHMNRILEHEVDEVWVGLHELIQLLQVAQLAALLLIKDVEVVLAGVELHVLDLGCQICLLLRYLFIAFFEFLLLFLQGANLLVNLFLHHLVQVLLLNLELLHDAAERLLEPINLIVELLADLELQL